MNGWFNVKQIRFSYHLSVSTLWLNIPSSIYSAFMQWRFALLQFLAHESEIECDMLLGHRMVSDCWENLLVSECLWINGSTCWHSVHVEWRGISIQVLCNERFKVRITTIFSSQNILWGSPDRIMDDMKLCVVMISILYDNDLMYVSGNLLEYTE